MMTHNTSSDPDEFLYSTLVPTHRITTNFASSSIPEANYHQNAHKKRSKLIKIDGSPTSSCSASVSNKPKYAKKPDPAAPKITRPCSECGKKFWSWKALFGHMRCHPERQWRGINPPPKFQRPVSPDDKKLVTGVENVMTLEDHEVAACLLMLGNGDGGVGVGVSTSRILQQGLFQVQDMNEMNLGGGVSCRFECNSCKKVFGSHQALGGHRASHKNVKGCFAITNSGDGGYEIDHYHCGDGIVKENVDDERKMMMVLGHKCSICLRVFSSGQALGGHKRCHWEKGDEPLLSQGLNLFDLNMPAPVDDDSASSSYSSELTLDLRLGL